MRTVSVNGILSSLSTNYNRRNKDVRLYELANVYLPKALPLTELPDERMKMVRMLIGALETVEQVIGLFGWLEIDQAGKRCSALLNLTSPVAYYVLFQTLRHAEGERELILRCCQALLCKGDDLSLNMVAILRAYFDLSELKKTLSLPIQPYELSYIDSSYANFEHVLLGKRPR